MTDKLPKWVLRFLSQDEFHRIKQAVAEAEKQTSGEIVPMVVRRSTTVGHVPIILLSVICILFILVDGLLYQNELFGNLFANQKLWILVDLPIFYGIALWLGRFSFLQRLLVSGEDTELQVNMRAELEFYEADLKSTRAQTGILLFISLMEHRVVVLADQAIANKLPPDTWNGVVNLIITGIKQNNLADGLTKGIQRCGEILKPHFPLQADDENELRDHLIIKE